eukprot:scaffold6882_cov117-Isochrysis_galbana.AAC.8
MRESTTLHHRAPHNTGNLSRRPLAPAGGPRHPRDRRGEKKKLEGLMRESTTLHHRAPHKPQERSSLQTPGGPSKAWEQPATTLWTAADACGHTASTPPRAPSTRPREERWEGGRARARPSTVGPASEAATRRSRQ